MSVNVSEFKTTNYLVPSSGLTHAVTVSGTFSAAPYLLDWRQYAIDNEKFQPQGVFIDNSLGTVDLIITVQPIGYTIDCPAGQRSERQFPAPNGQTMTITGDPNNFASVIFVDFPVLPAAGLTAIAGVANVNLQSAAPGAVVTTNPNPLAAGNTLPYRTQEYVSAPEFHNVQLAAGALTANIVPAIAQQNLRKLKIYLSQNATLAVAGTVTLSATLNGALIYSRTLYIPAVITVGDAGEVASLDFDTFAAPAAAGNLTITLSAALATGTVDANAYFTPQ